MKSNINFFFEDIAEPALDYTKIKYWLSLLIKEHNYHLLELNYILCSDQYLLEINKEHLNHDYYTDIITFDNSDKKNTIESDIFVSSDRIEDNATILNQKPEHETLRVLSHGILHLFGFKDKNQKDILLMRTKEDQAIALYYKIKVPRGTQ